MRKLLLITSKELNGVCVTNKHRYVACRANSNVEGFGVWILCVWDPIGCCKALGLLIIVRENLNYWEPSNKKQLEVLELALLTQKVIWKHFSATVILMF